MFCNKRNFYDLCSRQKAIEMRLSDLETGRSAVIIKILGHGAFRRRVMEMGFVKGREITAVLNAPLRDPVKYRLMDYEVSLRRSEAATILNL